MIPCACDPMNKFRFLAFHFRQKHIYSPVINAVFEIKEAWHDLQKAWELKRRSFCVLQSHLAPSSRCYFLILLVTVLHFLPYPSWT